MNMPKVEKCSALNCAYNMDSQCHAMAITVGDAMCAMCDTSLLEEGKKGGVADMTGTVGACKAETCRYNQSLECTAHHIDVKMHEAHAECATYAPR